MKPRIAILYGAALLGFFWASGIAHGDCNHNGISDDADLESGWSQDCNGNGRPDDCEVALVEFGISGSDLTFDGLPRSGATGDVNGDGIEDLAIRNRVGGVSLVTLFLGHPERIFSPLTFELGAETVVFFGAADFDLDGDVEFVGLKRGSAFVLDFRDGALTLVFEFPVPTTMKIVDVGDFNDDGLSDFVISGRFSRDVFVYLNRGDGSVEEPVVQSLGEGTSVALATGDLDGDGVADVVSANSDSEEVAVFFASQGALGEVTLYDLGQRPTRLSLVDLNQDDALDVIVVGAKRVSLFHNDGTGALVPQPDLRVLVGSLLVDDFNGDGSNDLLMTTSLRIFLFPNLGDGHFAGAQTLSNETHFLNSADLDDDGAPDLILTNSAPNRSQIFWNGGGAPILDFVPSTVEIGGPQPHFAALADFDRDGFSDVVTGNGADGSWTVLLNRRDGTFAPPITRPMGGRIAGCIRRSYFVAPGDFDGNGNIDVAMSPLCSRLVPVILNFGDHTEQVEYPVAAMSASVASADFDADGELDLVSVGRQSSEISILSGKGDGTFPQRRDVDIGGEAIFVLAIDLDRDDDPDLAIAKDIASEIVVLRNRGDGTFLPRDTYSVTGDPLALGAADLNADGKIDLFAGNDRSNEVSILLASGEGRFTRAKSIPIGRVSQSITAADMDGDGVLDIVTADRSNTTTVLFGLGNGEFTRQGTLSIGEEARSVLALDLEGDGDVDLIASNRKSSTVTILLNQVNEEQLAPDYLEQVCTALDFQGLSTASGDVRVERAGKYLVPAREDSMLLPTVFQNVRRFPLHIEFLRQAFPERFAGLGAREYRDLVERRASRQYFAGVISRTFSKQGLVYGFSVVTDVSDPGERLELAEVRRVYEKLASSFHLTPLGYLPETIEAREVAAGWTDPGFPVYGATESNVEYEPYTRAVGYGRVRLMDREGFDMANGLGQLSFQTIAVLDFAPRDIDGVVAAVITAQRQGELSHLSIRTARRGTPNAFVRDAREAFGTFDDQLVRLEVRDAEYTISETTVEEAEAFWAENRPVLEDLPSLDPDFEELSSLEEIAAMNLAGEEVVPRFGGKASNLARLQTVLTGPWKEYGEKGFAIPVRYYLEFLRNNHMPSGLDRTRDVSYEEFLTELFEDERFRADSQFRFSKLQDLREHMRDFGFVKPSLIEAVSSRITDVLGSPVTTQVRFRSSSNVEDAVEFNGAGLYDSTSGCAADDQDFDTSGPSRCDPTRNNERTIQRALKRVWSSLWNFRAHEERAFYGIPRSQTAMGILVNRSFLDESANGVAFTGNPFDAFDRRYVITAQAGEESVVSPEPGVVAEKSLLEVRDGVVVEIVRVTRSSLVPAGTDVLSDAQLEELGALMGHIDQEFSVQSGAHKRQSILLDLEFKFMPDGELAVKQIRPFLLPDGEFPTPVFELRIPAGTVVCGTFGVAGEGRGPGEELELKSTVHFRGGTFELPTDSRTFSLELIDEMRLGPERAILAAASPGRFEVERPQEGVGEYRFTFEKNFELPTGEELRFLFASPLTFEAEGEGEGEEIAGSTLTLDEDFFVRVAGRESFQLREGATTLVRYGDCDYHSLPAFRIEVRLEDGMTLELQERFDEVQADVSTGAAALTHAVVDLGVERRNVNDYWHLVYSAGRHNRSVDYWVVLEPPMHVPGVNGEVFVVAVKTRESRDFAEPEALYLDRNLDLLASVSVTSFERRAMTFSEPTFRRGDATADGLLDINDVRYLLDYLFGEAAVPLCHKSADANDDGRLHIGDAVAIALHLFGGRGPLSVPFGACVEDPTPDSLDCETYPACEG